VSWYARYGRLASALNIITAGIARIRPFDGERFGDAEMGYANPPDPAIPFPFEKTKGTLLCTSASATAKSFSRGSARGWKSGAIMTAANSPGTLRAFPCARRLKDRRKQRQRRLTQIPDFAGEDNS
jgi:hypothetical protein